MTYHPAELVLSVERRARVLHSSRSVLIRECYESLDLGLIRIGKKTWWHEGVVCTLSDSMGREIADERSELAGICI